MAVGDDLRQLSRRYSDAAIAMLDRKGPVEGFGQFILKEVDSAQIVACQPKAGYVPALGDLVIWDTTLNYGMDLAATDENPSGQIVVVRSATDFDVALFLPGTRARLAYSVAPALGDKIEIGTVTNQVRTDAANGIGRVIGLNIPTGYVDVIF